MVLAERFPQARLLRVDRDSASSRKQWTELLRRIHDGEADILVGTQMLAKGHDFPKLTLVGAIAPDAALFAADWRAPERLFAQLMQVAGRAGRAERPGEVLLQTQFPDHPLYQALRRHDYPSFAAAQLNERRQAGFPPYAYQAMLRAEAPRMGEAIAFLAAARDCAAVAAAAELTFYDPVPMRLSRRANMERGQLLVESPSRRALQAFLADWVTQIEALRVRRGCTGTSRSIRSTSDGFASRSRQRSRSALPFAAGEGSPYSPRATLLAVNRRTKVGLAMAPLDGRQ
jgi:primosomal protein N' (replication factor Y)